MFIDAHTVAGDWIKVVVATSSVKTELNEMALNAKR